MLTNLKFLFIFLIFYENQIYSWIVDCTNSGICAVSYSSISSSMIIYPGYMPIIPEKNIKPTKNINATIPLNISMSTNIYKFKLPFLKGSNQYECADGFNECPYSCCSKGLCKDASNQCLISKNTMKFIALMIIIFFIAALIFYWTSMYLIGVWYNEKPQTSKKDNIYIKPFKTNFPTASPNNENNILNNNQMDLPKENLANNIDFIPQSYFPNVENVHFGSNNGLPNMLYDSERNFNGDSQGVNNPQQALNKRNVNKDAIFKNRSKKN